MLNAQSPSLHIKISPPFPLQGAWVVGLFAETAQSRKGGILLLKFRLQVGNSGKIVDQNAKRIALESGVQIVILRCAVIDAEACTDHRLSVQGARRPG